MFPVNVAEPGSILVSNEVTVSGAVSDMSQ